MATRALPLTKMLGTAAAALLVFALPAASETAEAESPAAVRQVGPEGAVPAAAPASASAEAVDEIQRFCGNIADAARDRRYALQAKELEQLQADIDERMKALEAKRAEYETWMRKREVFLAQAQDGLVKIYGGMKPDAAAERLAELKPDLAAGILIKLDARKAGVILNEMKSKEAALLTTIMASAVRREDPT